MSICRSNIRVLVLAWVILLVTILSGCGPKPNPRITGYVDIVDDSMLRKHVEFMSTTGASNKRDAGSWKYDSEVITKKREYIISSLKSYGYKVNLESFSISKTYGVDVVNITAFKQGLSDPNHVIDVCAHYDTIDNPGADDDCSGVAGVLETARVLADIPTERSIRFCFFDLEEFGSRGSKAHVSLIKKRQQAGEEIFDGAIVYEMIGYASQEKDSQKTPIRIPFLCDPPRVGNFILVVGNFQSGDFGRDFELAIEAYVPELPYYSFNRLGGLPKDASRSDHYRYWQNKLPAIMITDTANFRNNNYHRNTDTANTLDYGFLKQVVQAGVGMVLEYAGLEVGEG